MPKMNDMENVGIPRVGGDSDPMESDVDAKSGSDGSTSLSSGKSKGGSKSRKGKKGDAAKIPSPSEGMTSDGNAADKPGGGMNGDNGGEDVSAKDFKKAGKVAKKAAGAANTGVKAGIMMKFMNALHMGMAMLGNMFGASAGAAGGILGLIGQAAAAVGAFFSGIGSSVAGFFMGAASWLSGALGIGATAATATVVTTGVTGAVATVLVVGSVVAGSMSVGTRDGRLVDCREVVAKAEVGFEVDADAQQLKNAQNIYSVLSTYGLSDEHIAGVLGNFSTESGIDPTTIEGIYDEDHNINGSQHQDAMKDWDAYVRGPLSKKYANSTASGGPVKNPGGYTASDGKMYPGIGMGQYTGGGAYTFLNFAESTGSQWYTVEFQIAYTLAKGAPASGEGFWERYKAETGSARDLAYYFSKYWEGNTSNGFPDRLDNADAWLSKMSGWSADSAYANSVIALAEKMGSVATENNVASKKDDCVHTISSDNSSIANAAVSFAYETTDEGRGNNGTELFQRVHDYIWPGESLYMSCDITVASAVRWAGADDEYPPWGTSTQLSYLLTSDKWDEVGMLGGLSYDKLMPGDVLCLDGHTLLFVGEDAVKAKYPNSDGNSVSGSYHERSPGVGRDTTYYMENNGVDSYHGKEYHVFRCVSPDNSTTYADAGK